MHLVLCIGKMLCYWNLIQDSDCRLTCPEETVYTRNLKASGPCLYPFTGFPTLSRQSVFLYSWIWLTSPFPTLPYPTSLTHTFFLSLLFSTLLLSATLQPATLEFLQICGTFAPLLPAPNRCQSLCSDRPSYSLSHLSGHTGPSKLSWDFAVSGNSWSSLTGHPPVCPSVRLQWPPCYAWFQFSTVQKQMTLLWQSRMAVQKQMTLLWLNVRR